MEPAITLAGPVLPIDRSALGSRLDTADAVLFAVTGSVVVGVASAVLVMVPVAPAEASAVIV